MKKVQTIIKTMCLGAIVFLMAQGCIPGLPIGGNPTPTPNPQSNIIYKIFDDTLYHVGLSDDYYFNFDSIKPLEINLFKWSFFYPLCTISFNDTNVKCLYNTYNFYGTDKYTFSTAKYAKADNNSLTWILMNPYWSNNLYQLSCGMTCEYRYNADKDKLTYVVFKAPLLSDSTRFAYGWLQLQINTNATSTTDGSTLSLYVKDGAIETNTNEIYAGYH